MGRGEKRGTRSRPAKRGKLARGSGRPTSYDPAYDQQAFVACSRLGAGLKEVGLLFGVSRSTVMNWMRDYPTFAASINSGRDIFDSGKVERSLLKRAVGYTYDEVKSEAITISEGRGKNKESIPAMRVSKTTKEVVPDVTACIYWLQNRQPDRWKDLRRVVEKHLGGTISHLHQHEGKLELDLGKLGVKELEHLRDILTKAIPADEAPSTARFAAVRGGFALARRRFGRARLS